MEAATRSHPAARFRRLGLLAVVAVGIAALSLLAPSTPSYDAWAWLIWGREAVGGELDTTAGPAWKPLPVLVTAVLSPLAWAPEAWLLLARAAAVAAVLLVGSLAWRLSGSKPLAGLVASSSLVLVAGFVRGAALGLSEGLLVALLAASAHRHLDGRPRQALVLATLAALLRPEVWPFLLVYGVVLWRRREARPLVVAAAVAVPLLWFGPELWGSGELLRSTERARIPNPGQPALAAVPALEVAKQFVLLTPPAAIVGAAASLALVRARPVALAALGWVALVALMSQAGFSGEQRYLIAAAAAASVAAGVGWVSVARRRRGLALCVALLLAPGPFVAHEANDLRHDLADDAALRTTLRRAVADAGGAGRLRCGGLAAGRYRFPLVAWHLEVPISALDFSLHGRPGVVLRSRLRRGERVAPPRPAQGRLLSRAGSWEIWGTCDS